MWGAMEISTLIVTCGSVFVSILSQVQNSRCTEINIGCGLFNCKRTVPDVIPADPLESIP